MYKAVMAPVDDEEIKGLLHRFRADLPIRHREPALMWDGGVSISFNTATLVSKPSLIS
jgi:hypothetical protein